jgi:hypothetical protein
MVFVLGVYKFMAAATGEVCSILSLTFAVIDKAKSGERYQKTTYFPVTFIGSHKSIPKTYRKCCKITVLRSCSSNYLNVGQITINIYFKRNPPGKDQVITSVVQ